MATNEKHQKNRENITSKSSCFFTLIFLGFWSQLGWILASKLRPKSVIPLDLFPSCGQEASKRRPRGSKSVPRASQEPPTASQEGPKSAQERSKRAQGTVPAEGHFFEDFLVFQRFSAVFCVFLRFSVFFCVFLCFFCVFLQRTPVNFSTLSSKLNCVRQQAKASKSKQKQAKGSQRKPKQARAS